ncbi:hypothetical protein Mapa_005206 [Marchantia paleacea]|nr:hypothetical protein Mapa_005206 [Marchantia paleacea]
MLMTPVNVMYLIYVKEFDFESQKCDRKSAVHITSEKQFWEDFNKRVLLKLMMELEEATNVLI